MILILSTRNEHPTAQVIYWLKYYKAPYFRINHFLNESSYEVLSHRVSVSNEMPMSVELTRNSRVCNLKDVEIVWFRRFQVSNELTLKGKNASLSKGLNTARVDEKRALYEAFITNLKHAYWLSHPSNARLNKLLQLSWAAESGFNIPATIVVTEKESVVNFYKKYMRIITKAIQDISPIKIENGKKTRSLTLYTCEFNQGHIDQLPLNFFPTLFQQYIEKDVELRVYYLNGRCWAAAMFTQKSSRTIVDFRRYDYQRPTRIVPYNLPKEIIGSIQAFMSKANLNTGSLDIIIKNNLYYFLEVNPVGQFGFISNPCNFHIEKIIAEELISKLSKNATEIEKQTQS